MGDDVGLSPIRDAVGRQILPYLDPLVFGLITIPLIAALIVFRKRRYGAMPNEREYFRVVFASFALLGGLTTGVVFLLTDPPAVEALSRTDRAIVGIVVLIAVVNVSIRDMWKVFHPESMRQAPSAPPPDPDNGDAST